MNQTDTSLSPMHLLVIEAAETVNAAMDADRLARVALDHAKAVGDAEALDAAKNATVAAIRTLNAARACLNRALGIYTASVPVQTTTAPAGA